MKNQTDYRQAITTKYIGPSNTRGSRVRASCEAGSITIEWNNALNSDQNHRVAAMYLQEKFGWHKYNTLIGGVMPKNKGYCFVQVAKKGK